MDRVDTMKAIQGWTDTSITHFRDLGFFGEQLLLSIRLDNWNSYCRRRRSPAGWAATWRNEVQRYIHAYRTATGVDLMAGADADHALGAARPSGVRPAPGPELADFTSPLFLGLPPRRAHAAALAVAHHRPAGGDGRGAGRGGGGGAGGGGRPGRRPGCCPLDPARAVGPGRPAGPPGRLGGDRRGGVPARPVGRGGGGGPRGPRDAVRPPRPRLARGDRRRASAGAHRRVVLRVRAAGAAGRAGPGRCGARGSADRRRHAWRWVCSAAARAARRTRSASAVAAPSPGSGWSPARRWWSPRWRRPTGPRWRSPAARWSWSPGCARTAPAWHSSPPTAADVAAALAACDRRRRATRARRRHLAGLVRRLRDGPARARAARRPRPSPLVTVAGPAGRPLALHRALAAAGVAAVLRRPRCRGGPVLTLSVSAAHRPRDVDDAVAALRAARRQWAAGPAGARRRRAR